MRQSQQKNRMRGRGRKGPSPLSRTLESNGPDVKIRGTASHIAEKYASLARDALSAGDTVMGENYLQHAEHYNRIVAAAAAQNNRQEDGSNAGRGPQPEVAGFNGANGGGGENEEERAAGSKSEDSAKEPAQQTARSEDGGEAEEPRAKPESRGRRRQRQSDSPSSNGNGHDVEAANGEAPRRAKREGMSSDASMLPDSIVGGGGDAPQPEKGAED